jgi:hypothetical protein
MENLASKFSLFKTEHSCLLDDSQSGPSCGYLLWFGQGHMALAQMTRLNLLVTDRLSHFKRGFPSYEERLIPEAR